MSNIGCLSINSTKNSRMGAVCACFFHKSSKMTNNGHGKSVGEYTIVKTLHDGSNSAVFLARRSDLKSGPSSNSKNSDMIILKRIPKSKTKECFLKAELEAGKRLKHPNIAEVLGSFEDASFTYIAMEYVKGLDLFTYLETRKFRPMGEDRGKKLFKQMLDAVIFASHNGISHRDLKLENIIISNTENDSENPKQAEKLSLIDFGLCGVDHENFQSIQFVGSADYCSPEILLHEPYNAEKADVYSLGVILFILLVGKLPFQKKKRFELLQQRQHPEVVFPNFVLLSSDAKDLIKKMLTFEPLQRISLQAISIHPWMTDA